jgi:hypothetical protein
MYGIWGGSRRASRIILKFKLGMNKIVVNLYAFNVGVLMGCCPNENLFERSLKRFLLINLGEVKEKRFQLFEPEG